MTKHTPGPWCVNWAGSGKNGHFVYDECYVYAPGCGVEDVAVAADIADPLTGKPSTANARLIAAAPEMLSALEKFEEYEVAAEKGNDLQMMLSYAEFSKMARAAIEKATRSES